MSYVSRYETQVIQTHSSCKNSYIMIFGTWDTHADCQKCTGFCFANIRVYNMGEFSENEKWLKHEEHMKRQCHLVGPCRSVFISFRVIGMVVFSQEILPEDVSAPPSAKSQSWPNCIVKTWVMSPLPGRQNDPIDIKDKFIWWAPVVWQTSHGTILRRHIFNQYVDDWAMNMDIFYEWLVNGYHKGKKNIQNSTQDYILFYILLQYHITSASITHSQ